MNRQGNLAVICDVRENKPVGVICSCPHTGDIAYSSEESLLIETLDIILDNKLFLLNEEKISNRSMIREEDIDNFDSYVLMAINYSLPFPWRMLGVTSVNGDPEQIVEEAFAKLKQGGVNIE